MNVFKKIIVILCITVSSLFAQDTVRVMTYNLLMFPSNSGFSRLQYFKKVIDAVNPDILVVEEMQSSAGVSQFLNSALNNKYKAGQFYARESLNQAMFYKDSLFEFISNIPITVVNSNLNDNSRDINQFTIKHKFSGDTLLVYAVHLKASQGAEEENQRLEETTRLRSITDNLPHDKYFLVTGDFNVYTASEPAFQKLLDQNTPGYFLDPINALINWHNNSSARSLHTQSTRDERLSDLGSDGGLDDRFDMILISQTVKDPGGISYIGGSYTPYGNDAAHFDMSINVAPNSKVSQEIADALYYASDHLPVFADFEFSPPTGISDHSQIVSDYRLYQNFPNPFNPITRIEFDLPSTNSSGIKVNLRVYDILGREILELVNETKPSGHYNVDFDASNLTSGIYFYVLSTDQVILSRKMVLLK